MRATRAHILLLAFLTLGQTTAIPAQAQPDFRTENLRAFTKLYGYVRWFHPSDEASAIDWDRFAIHGAAQIAGLSATDDLHAELDALFLPIAPSVVIFSGAAPPSDTAPHTPAGEKDLELVAWQHRGVGLGQPGPYQSARLNRATEVAAKSPFGGVVQSVDATEHRGKALRLTAQAKTASGSQVQLWVRIDRAPKGVGFFENMDERPIRATEWKTYEIVGKIDADASRIAFGGFLPGKGEVWLDDFTLSVREPGQSWTPLPIANPGFEAGASGGPPQGWGSGAPESDYKFTTSDADHAEGRRSVQIRSVSRTIEESLFDSHPSPHEFVDVDLGRRLRARIPIALYSRDGHTLPASSTETLASLQKAIEETVSTPATDPAVRIAAVTIAWNIFQHFYPYFDVVKTDWDAVLTESLERAITNETAEEFDETLRWLIAQLHDGHGFLHHPALAESRLPFLSKWIDGKAVVVASAPGAVVQRGDVLHSIDGVAIEQLLTRDEALRSGSPQWKRFTALASLGSGAKGTTATVNVERGGKTLALQVPRNLAQPLVEPRPESFAELRPGVMYVDLTAVEMPAIEARMTDLAAARGVVFDLRGYPKGNHAVLQHLTDEPLQSARWQVPRVIYPDRERLAGYEESGRWSLEPKMPRFKGKIVFLTDARAISYAESVMGIVEHYRLGDIVGSPTAGTNGNVNGVLLPGGFRIGFTGMRVLKHDGSQHHLTGIRPTVPIKPTLKGIRAGQDEVLDKALELIEITLGEKGRK